jgi:hypothetical protein
MGVLGGTGDEDALIRLGDGKRFLPRAVNEFHQEIINTRKNERLMAYLESRARKKEVVPITEARRRLGL